MPIFWSERNCTTSIWSTRSSTGSIRLPGSDQRSTSSSIMMKSTNQLPFLSLSLWQMIPTCPHCNFLVFRFTLTRSPILYWCLLLDIFCLNHLTHFGPFFLFSEKDPALDTDRAGTDGGPFLLSGDLFPLLEVRLLLEEVVVVVCVEIIKGRASTEYCETHPLSPLYSILTRRPILPSAFTFVPWGKTITKGDVSLSSLVIWTPLG
mmetsp:Transcript_32341/g.63197  ORF Transcript_32341/g.63197 Transcript_32341/m.63197 type:complete len:206 (+) Transcript_32341:494-1111(+)